jgi:hypothetical protein
VIIVSESPAEVTLRVRTERCAPMRSCSSAAPNDTLRSADARPISVHTEEHNRPNINCASGGPRSGMAPDRALERWAPRARVSRHAGAGGVAGRGEGIQIVQPLGAPSGCLPPDPLQGKLADATGYPLPTLRPAAGQHPACAISVPLPPVNHGQQRYPVTRPDHRSKPLAAC